MRRIPTGRRSARAEPVPPRARPRPPLQEPPPETTDQQASLIDIDWDKELAQGDTVHSVPSPHMDESETVDLTETSSDMMGGGYLDEYVVDPAYLPDTSDSETGAGDLTPAQQTRRAGCSGTAVLLLSIGVGAGFALRAVLRLMAG